MAINLENKAWGNTEPYYDDFSQHNKFYRILYRPGYAVQARELTQMQTILQNQIATFGNHVFKEGARVIPGEASVDIKADYVKLESSYAGVLTDTVIADLLGKTIENSAGLRAEVFHYSVSENGDNAVLYVRYLNSANDNVTKVFQNSDVIKDLGKIYELQVATTNATGYGSLAQIKQGVYFIRNHFVLVESQTVILDKFSNTPSYRIGLLIEEKVVIPEDDQTLFDNAQNSYNYAAPGAHRYYISATLTKLQVNSISDDNFIELIRTGEGEVEKIVTTTEYSELEKTFARRTYDESGDYTIRNFELDVREYRDNNRGAWSSNRVYLIGDIVTNSGKTYVAKNSGTSLATTPPTHSSGLAYDGPGNTGIQWEYTTNPAYNRGIYKPANSATLAENKSADNKLAIGLEPGKAYVQGYELEKFSTEYIPVNKCRDSSHIVQTENKVIPVTVGNYVLVTNVNNLPPVNTFAEITIYDRFTSTRGIPPAGATAIGTARARFIEWDNGVIGQTTAVYKLSIFDIKMNGNYDFVRTAKSFYYNVDGSQFLSFTADIAPIRAQLAGSVSASGTTITGTGTSFQTDFLVGDYFSVTNTVGGVETARIATITGQNTMTIDASTPFSGTITNSAYNRISTSIVEPENNSLLFPIPNYAIKSVRSSTAINDTIYTVYERFSQNANGSGVVSIVTSSGAFASAADSDNYIVVDNSVADGGEIISVSSGSITGTGTSAVSIALGAGYANHPILVIAAINKSGAVLTEKTKEPQLNQTVEFTTQAAAQKSELTLGHADGYRLISVKMKSGTFASPGATYSIDITDRYDFDDGQRATHYDLARIILKKSYAPPEAPIEVTFDYFTHSSGDYFTVNSYQDKIDYKFLPYFKNIPLRDCIDFRPRVSDFGTSFIGTGGSLSLIPKRGIDVVADYTYYLSRKTKIALDINGNFFNVDGVPSLNPGEPLDPNLALVLYNLEIEPYTFGTTDNNVRITKLDNKRYTMRDIGKLEKRIDNLEYYTSLSLLEQQTESLNITDSAGNDRFKNGFIVDGFQGHNTGDTGSPDYLCSIDMNNAELRPFFSMQNINLLEKNSTDAARNSSNYKLYGDVITLPKVEDVPLVTQAYASRLENINPFAVFTFIGDVKINPSSDDWFEIDRRPDIVIDVEGNFTTLKTIAEKSGVLGTVWNSWQTQWTGESVTTSTLEGSEYVYNLAVQRGVVGKAFSTAGGMSRFVGSYTLTETTATQVGQSRSGIKTSLVAKIDRQVVADRVLSTAAIPYMRSRNVLVQIQKLKPNTRFYPFFDNADISAYVTPASKLIYIPSGGSIEQKKTNHNLVNVDTNTGGSAAATSRRINGDSQVCLNKGDVITGATSGATAVVVGKEYNPDDDTFALFVVNLIGTFTTNENFTGSISGVTGEYLSVTTKNQADALVTNFAGDIQFLFNIPNTEAVRFRCGSRELKLVDVPTVDGDFTSRARANYRAEGVLETRQSTVHAVRNAELVEERITENRVITQTTERIVSGSAWYDPLAQSFLIDVSGGCFLTKVDVFFGTKDDKIPVTLEIREMVNGYPGKRVLPFSRVTLKPEFVNLSNNSVTLDGQSVPSYDTPTSFVFPSPVYVQENQEYAIVLSSDSNGYNCWVSQMGEIMPGTTRTISEQPYLGTLFKSQNASTWTADQTQDLKFVIYRARWQTGVNANIEYVNDALPLQNIGFDPFETRIGSNKVRVWHDNHGLTVSSAGVGSKVIISPTTYGTALTGTITTTTSSTTVTGSGTAFTTQLVAGSCLYKSDGTFIGKIASVSGIGSAVLAANATVALTGASVNYIAPFNGIPANEIFTTSTISDVDLDSYVITVTTNATSSGYAGGSGIRATRNIQFDAIQPSIQLQSFTETPVEFGIKTTKGRSVDADSSQVPYVQDSDFNGIVANDTNYFSVPRMVSSEVNETNFLSGNKSITMNVKMSSTNDALSPILDTHRTSLIAISNKVNDPTETNVNVSVLDHNTILSANNTIAFSNPTLWTASSSLSLGVQIYYGYNMYTVVVAGTTSTNPPVHNSGTVMNGTAKLRYDGPVEGTISSVNTTAQAALASLSVGKYITVSGAANVGNNKTFLITAVDPAGTNIKVNSILTTESAGSSVTLVQRERFVSENAPLNSSTYSKYLTRKINLSNPSTMIRVKFAVNLPADATVEVWYKTNAVGETSSFDSLGYKQMISDTTIANYPNESNKFVDASFSVMDLNAFTSLKVKLVLKSKNTSQVPRIKDLRVIALA